MMPFHTTFPPANAAAHPVGDAPRVRSFSGIIRTLLLFVVATLWLPIPANADPDTSVPANLTIDSLSPEILSVGKDLQITATLHDVTLTDAAWSFAQVFIQPAPLLTEDDVARYLDGSQFPGWPVSAGASDPFTQSITSDGKSTKIEIAVPADLLPQYESLSTTSFGIMVRFSTDQGESEARNLIVYDTTSPEPQTKVNIVAFDLSAARPLEADEPVSSQEALDQATAQLRSQVAASADLAGIAGVSLAVLPGFFAATETPSSILPSLETEAGSEVVSGETPSPTSSTPPTLQEQLADERDAIISAHRDKILQQSIDLIALPDADADLTLLASTDQSPLLDFAVETRDPARSVSGAGLMETAKANLLSEVALSSNEGFTRAALTALRGNAIIAPSNYALLGGASGDITPTSRLVLDAATGALDPRTSLVGDSDRPSADIATPENRDTSVTVIDGWTAAMDLINQPLGSESEELLLRQRLRALGISVGQEDPEDTRSLSVILDVSRETSSPAIAERVRALLDNDWITPISFAELLKSPASIVPRETVLQRTPTNDSQLSLAQGQLTPLSKEIELATAIAGATPLGRGLLAPYTDTTLRPVAHGVDSAQREPLIATALEALATITQAIEILPQGTLNVINHSADFPVTVANRGDTDVSLQITIKPNDPRLQIKRPVSVKVPAGEQVAVTVPVTAVGSGDVGVRLQAQTPAGAIVDDSQEIMVRVRANWEDAGTIAVSAGLLLLFAFGVIRTILKGRRRNRQLASSDTVNLSNNSATGAKE